MKKAKKPMKISAEKFDRRFDNGEDITPYLDPSKATRPKRELPRVNVDFPSWMVNAMAQGSGTYAARNAFFQHIRRQLLLLKA